MAVQWETLNIACVVYHFTQKHQKRIQMSDPPKIAFLTSVTFREGCDKDAGGSGHLSPHLSKEEEAALPTDRPLLSHNTFEAACGTAA